MQQLQQLKCNSLKLEEGMPVKWPKLDKPGQLKPSLIISSIKNEKAYAYTSRVIAFICEGELYVTPYKEDSLQVIRNSGYKLREFHVPFSQGDAPQGEYGERWQALLAIA